MENWNKDKQCVRGTNSEAVVLNEFLKSLRVRIYEEEIKLVKHGFAITAMLLRDALLNKLAVEYLKGHTLIQSMAYHFLRNLFNLNIIVMICS